MMMLTRKIVVPDCSAVFNMDYIKFIETAYMQFSGLPQYFANAEDINSIELAHLIPEVSETMLAIYVGINDAVCNKGLITPLLPQHCHNNVFVFDNQVYSGGNNVPNGTIDAKSILNGFMPANETWNKDWTYVMVADSSRTFQSLWQEKGYIDMIPAKFEDFTMLSDFDKSKACIFISPKCFEHPVNKSRAYLKQSLNLGEKLANDFKIPQKILDEFEGLVPVVLNKGEKLYVATTDFSPCAHGWCNIHPDNQEFAVINEISAVPLDLVIAKPPINPKYSKGLIPPKGSADMTTDWFKRGQMIMRKPLLAGLFKG
ncbi:MAG: hypothetical protein A2Y12_03705 [Planctomycetes bacterium GWF2_42_9]|nr:MAG: hypothetical protein A2Y12_03705 [Planctomycetes bacterium GWF2_42_9]